MCNRIDRVTHESQSPVKDDSETNVSTGYLLSETLGHVRCNVRSMSDGLLRRELRVRIG